MITKIILFLVLICYFTPPKEATPLNQLKITSVSMFSESGCPVSSKRISPEINDSPFLVGTDGVTDPDTTEKSLIVAPISTKLFKKLQLVVLPTREVCVLGEKLKNLRLPYYSEFEIMTGIAIWFSPCVSRPTHMKRMECFDKKMNSINGVDIALFKDLHEFLVAAFQDL